MTHKKPFTQEQRDYLFPKGAKITTVGCIDAQSPQMTEAQYRELEAEIERLPIKPPADLARIAMRPNFPSNSYKGHEA